MLNVNKALTYTPEQILEYYRGTGKLPLNKPIYNAVAKEQFLQMKEMVAYAMHLGDMEQVEMWSQVVAIVEPYMQRLRSGGDSAGERRTV